MNDKVKISAVASKAGSPEELGLHEGSARYKVMRYVLRNKAKARGTFEVEMLMRIGDYQAVRFCVRRGYLH